MRADIVIPEIKRHLSDEQLSSEWLSGKSPGLTDIQRLINLSVLLEFAGAHGASLEVQQELEMKSAGKATDIMVKQHLQNLNRVRPKNGNQ